MKKALLASLLMASLAGGALAQDSLEAKRGKPVVDPSGPEDRFIYFRPQGWKGKVDTQNRFAKALSSHGGPVLTVARVVFIFWGPNFANLTHADHTYATSLQAFRDQFGVTDEYNVITQYSGIRLTDLGAGADDLFDTTTPPTNVTDASVRTEVNKYLATHTFDNSTIYEVVLPSTSYSSNAGGTSCGGSPLQYCAYHSHFSSSGHDVKYSIEPWPSCGGCQVAGWTAVQNQEHFVTHETREAVTDPDLNAWWDSGNGDEADDKCNWSPTPFLASGFGYQWEWSNTDGGCVKTRTAGKGYFTVSPCRLADTRGATGPQGGPALAAGASRTFTVGGLCGIPPEATAVAVSVTAVQPTTAGFLTLYQAGGSRPATSSINFSAGQVRSNEAIVRITGAPLGLTIFYGAATGTTNVVLDINGFFR
jgi:hypothetical protein